MLIVLLSVSLDCRPTHLNYFPGLGMLGRWPYFFQFTGQISPLKEIRRRPLLTEREHSSRAILLFTVGCCMLFQELCGSMYIAGKSGFLKI